MPKVAPINVNTAKVESGFQMLEPGWYALKVTDHDNKTTKDGMKTRTLYKTEVVAGPGNTMDAAGRKFQDSIMDDQQWAGRHMELYAACMGGAQAVRDAAAQAGGGFDLDWLIGKTYLALITQNGNFNNIARRAIYNATNWNLICANEDPEEIDDSAGNGTPSAPQAQAPQAAAAPPAPGGIMTPQQAPAPQPQAAAPAPAPQPQASPPQMPAPAPQAAPAPTAPQAAGGPPVPPTSVPTPGQ